MPAASRVPLFLLIFALLFTLAFAVVLAQEFSDVKWVKTVVTVAEGLGRLTFVSIAITFILVEGIPLLAAWYKKQMIREAHERGRAEERKDWIDWTDRVQEWEKRRVTAQNEGRDFDEPRPAAPGTEHTVSVQ